MSCSLKSIGSYRLSASLLKLFSPTGAATDHRTQPGKQLPLLFLHQAEELGGAGVGPVGGLGSISSSVAIPRYTAQTGYILQHHARTAEPGDGKDWNMGSA